MGAKLSDLMLAAGVLNSPGWFSDIDCPNWPMEHQMAAFKNYAANIRYGDFSDPGCGKTFPAQMHGVLMAALKNKTVFTMPPKLIDQFEQELKDFFVGVENTLTIGTLDCPAGEKMKRIERWDEEGWPDILLLSYEMYRRLNDPANKRTVPRNLWRTSDGQPFWNGDGTERVPKAKPFTADGRPISPRGKADNRWLFKLKRSGYSVYFFDEAHALCGASSIISRAVKELDFRMKDDVAIYLMTGTPVPTHLEDSYGIITLINPDAYSSRASFERQHCVTEQFKVRGSKGKTVKVKRIVGYLNTEKVHEALYANATRVQKRDVVALPEPVIGQIRVKLAKKHKALYDKVVKDRFAVLGDTVLAPDSQSEMRALALQLISCPDEFDPSLSMDNEVAAACDQYLNSVNPANFKIIIFAYHKRVIRYLGERYKEWNPAVVFGESAGSKEIQRFKTDPKCRIAIINWLSGGAGLNLQMSHHILFYECPTSPKDAKQAIARADRTGQANIVNATFLRAMGTFSDRNFKNLLRNEESNNQVVKDKKDLLHEYLK
jgi:SNF2 family DNA or RNA helicase